LWRGVRRWWCDGDMEMIRWSRDQYIISPYPHDMGYHVLWENYVLMIWMCILRIKYISTCFSYCVLCFYMV
jgi:hypothetical protein